MKISTELIKELREKTGAGVLSCKNALVDTQGSIPRAIEILRKKGLASAEEKLARTTKQGAITSYVHTGAKIGVLLELNCETDFVARRIEFQTLSRNIAMQIVASNIMYISLKDIPIQIWDTEIGIERVRDRDDLQSKPSEIRYAVLKGRAEKTLKTFCLMDQYCIRDPELTVENYIKNHVALLGENIQVARFVKFVLGEKEQTIIIEPIKGLY